MGARATPTPLVDFQITLDPGLDATVEVPEIGTVVPEVTVPAIPTLGGDRPEDIPVVEPNENLFASADAVSYETTTSFDDVKEFYKEQMPANGWEESPGALEFGDTAILNYTKDGRTAVVTLSVNSGKTVVVIGIANQ
jgi:hypothetical protein